MEEEKPVYSWKKKVATSELSPVVLHCQHYALKVEKEMPVELKGTGSESIQVNAIPGEYLIFDHQGYLVFVMEPKSFSAKCNENQTLEDHKKALHKADKLEKELTVAKAKITDLEKQLQDEPNSGDAPEQPATNPKQEKPAPKKKSVCTLEEAEMGRRVAKATKFFTDHAEKWHNSKVSWKITKIYRTKGEKQEIIIEVADYKGVISGLRTLIGGQRRYYQLCVDSFKLTKVEKPAIGTYVLLVKEAEMKKIYTTKGPKKYALCLKTYRELLKCSFEGTCTAEQSQKWKKLYKECGDLQLKLEKQPEVLSHFHKEVKKRRKAGELYSEAMSRVAQEIKAGKV